MKENYSFKGFSNETISFLENLEINNNKQWFETHKSRLRKVFIKSTKRLVNDLTFTMKTIDPYIEVSPSINKTISRIYRDTRFSEASLFFELSANYYRYGMGFYNATLNTMRKFRERVNSNQDEFKKTISFFAKQNTFVLEGEKYKRVFDKSESAELQEWYQRKNFHLVCNKNKIKLFSVIN